MPLAADICKFNNGSQKNSFKDLISAYHRSLLNMASIIVVLEFNLNVNAYTFNYGVTYLHFINYNLFITNIRLGARLLRFLFFLKANFNRKSTNIQFATKSVNNKRIPLFACGTTTFLERNFPSH